MNERASPMYTSEFLCRLFEQESQGLFDAREVVLGQTQQGGAPSPFDRILGTRLAAHSIDWLSDQIDSASTGGAVIGLHEGKVRVLPLRRRRGAGRLGAPAPAAAVVDAAAADHRHAGQPTRRRPGRLGLAQADDMVSGIVGQLLVEHLWAGSPPPIEGGQVGHSSRLVGLSQPLDVAEMPAVEPDPAAGVAGDLRGQAGRLRGSGVGHDGKELVSQRDHTHRGRMCLELPYGRTGGWRRPLESDHVSVTRNSNWLAHLPEGSDPAGLDLLAAGSLPAAWRRLASDDPGRPALWAEGPGWRTRGDLAAAGARVAGRLAAGRAAPPATGCWSARPPRWTWSWPTWPPCASGLVVVPANTAYREREVAHIVADAGPGRPWSTTPSGPAGRRRAAAATCWSPGPRSTCPTAPAAALDGAGPDDPALLCYTSGTTGAPKGAVLTHGNLLASAEAVRLAWRWTPDDRLVLALPLFHIHGLGVGLHGTLLAGASAVLLPRFEPDAVLDAAADHGATLFFGVPTMYTRLADSPRAGELARLRLCVSGSAPLPPSCSSGWPSGPRPAGARALRHDRDGHERLEPLRRRAAAGHRRACPCPASSCAWPTGPARSWCGARTCSPATGDRPEATAEAFDADGWFRTGDIGELDDDGYLRIVGRAKELIITGGYNVYPREVEDVLLEPPGGGRGGGGRDADPTSGARSSPPASCPPAPAAPPAATSSWPSPPSSWPPSSGPGRSHFVDALPRNALGKVLKHELAGVTPSPRPAPVRGGRRRRSRSGRSRAASRVATTVIAAITAM